MKIDLNSLRIDAIYDIQSSINIINTSMKWSELFTEVKRLCDQFLNAGCASIFIDLKPETAKQNFCRAAENWRRLGAVANQHYGVHLSLNHNDYLFAGMIAGDINLVNAVKNSLSTHYYPNEEYRENFHITWLLVLLVLQGRSLSDSVLSHIKALEMEDNNECRVVLAKSLLKLEEQTETDFWDAFGELISSYEIQVEKRSKLLTTSMTEFGARRYLNFEALVWLKLAMTFGFTRNGVFRFCPEELINSQAIEYKKDWIILNDLSV